MAIYDAQRPSEVTQVPNQRTMPGEAVRFHVEMQPDRPAFVSSGFASLPYRKLQHCISGAGAALRAAGLNRNARIAVAMPNGPRCSLGERARAIAVSRWDKAEILSTLEKTLATSSQLSEITAADLPVLISTAGSPKGKSRTD